MPDTNRILELIVDKLAQELTDPHRDWDRIVQGLRQHPVYGDKEFRINELARRLAEIDFLQTLGSICDDFPGVQQDPIPNGAEKGQYLFRYGHGGLSVYKELYQLVAVEKVLLAGDLPVVMRMKLARNNGGGQKRVHPKSKQVIGAKSTRYAFSAENMDLFLTPFKAYFEKKDVGYVLIVYADQIQGEASSIQRGFMSRGGIIVPFYAGGHQSTARESHLAAVKGVCNKFGIQYRPAP